jgi:hypothetical protein
VHVTTGRASKTIGQVPATVVRLSEEIAAQYHTCLTPYRAEPGTLDMSDGPWLDNLL